VKKLLPLLALVLYLAPARAEHAHISLRVIQIDAATGKSREDVAAQADQEPPQGGLEARPLVKAKAREPLVLQFFFTNTYPHGVTKKVTVRYFVVREEKLKQKNVPDLAQGTVLQGDFQMNFKPKCRVGARVAFTVPEPGLYLLRVDSLNTNSDHEHFAALDLQVE
jgi:hypothetical protein